VLSGISNGDPLSTRAARMKIYMDFVAALDASGEGVSHRLSEVNVSNPEDVQAILSDSDILVHFGDEKYLERYRQYQAHLAEWRVQYPKLASVDMRYEQQVVLQMQPGTAAPTGDSAPVAGTSGVSAPATAKPAVATAKKRLATKKLAALRLKPNGKPKGAALPGASR
jgi:cell division protein FtsQ